MNVILRIINGIPIGQKIPAKGAFTELKASTDPVDEHGVGDRGFNDVRYMLKDLDVTTVTDPAIDAAVTTAIVNSYGGVIITLTGAGNSQTLGTPTDATIIKRFIVVIKGAHNIQVNGITMTGGEAQWFIWDSASWVAIEAVDADDITFTPTGDIIATNVQSAIAEVDNEKMKRVTLVDHAITRASGTGGDIQGYTSNTPTVDDAGLAAFPGGFGGANLYLGHNVETLNATKTLTITDKVIQKLDPNGTDRNILLPAEGDSTDLVFFIHNMGGEVGEELFIQNDAGGALTEIHYHQIAFCTCDGSTWTVRAIAEEAGTDIVSVRVKEGNTGAIVTGQPVYISGAAGVAVPLVLLAECDDVAKAECVGLMAEDVSKNGAGYARAHGWLGGVDSSKGGVVNPGSEDWEAGDPLYVSRTTGGLTNVRPTSGRIIDVGIALTVEGNNSKILVHIHTASVKITTASGEDIVQRMGDSAGATKISYKNYANNEVAKMSSKGLLSAGIEEIVKASSSVLVAIELKGTIISNYGQGASNNLQQLPTAAEGMSFVAMCGTAQAANYFGFRAGASDKIYLDGTDGSDNGSVLIAAPVVGAMIVFFTFQTGASVWDWAATIISGTWVAA